MDEVHGAGRGFAFCPGPSVNTHPGDISVGEHAHLAGEELRWGIGKALLLGAGVSLIFWAVFVVTLRWLCAGGVQP